MTRRLHNPTWTRPYARVIPSGGPSRVKDEAPPEGWEPRPFMGFGYREESTDESEG